jgi:hypothetical protein
MDYTKTEQPFGYGEEGKTAYASGGPRKWDPKFTKVFRMEEQLDEIIRLLKDIEYTVRTRSWR